MRKIQTSAQMLARSAARKKGSPVVVESTPAKNSPKTDNIDEKTGYTVTSYIREKVVGSSNTVEYWRTKVIETARTDPTLQLDILEKAEQLMKIPYNLSYDDYNHSFNRQLSELDILQSRQNFSRASWKVIIVPIFIPPIQRSSILVCGIFHTARNMDVFSNWELDFGSNVDFKLSRDPFIGQVDQHENENFEISKKVERFSLDGKEFEMPPHSQPRGDWSSIIGDVRNFAEDDSFGSVGEKMNDSSENSKVETFIDSGTFQELPEKLGCPTKSEEIVKIINTTRKNLTKGEKLSILEGSRAIHSVTKRADRQSLVNKKFKPKARYIPLECLATLLYKMVGRNTDQ